MYQRCVKSVIDTKCRMVADALLFNSFYCMQSFLPLIPAFLNKIPDYRPSADVVKLLRAKARVIHFPVDLPRG